MAIDWGQIGTNVLATLGTGLSAVGLQALQGQIGDKIQQVKPAVEAATQKQTAAPVPVAGTPAWQKFAPYALGGGAVLVLAWFMTKGRRR